MLRKPTTGFVYLLGAYVIVQFIWWGYHLIDLTRASRMDDSLISKRVIMIIGEGTVFLSLLLFGLYKIKSSIRKEMRIARQQHNFLLSVTHELKTPIAANKLYLQTLLKHSLTEEKRHELMQKAIDETNRLELLVEQILTASRIEQGQFGLHKEQFNLKDFFDSLITVQEKRFDMPISSHVPSLPVHTDRMVLTTICNNLIENAFKYGYSERGLDISVSHDELYLQIRIRDYGIGIPADQQRMVFRKFVRLENEETRTTKGTGLGLYIAYEFTRALGGQLRLITSETPGACFEITLPYE